MRSELAKFYALIEDIEVAMMTVRRSDGHLESRAMANQKQGGGSVFVVLTADGTGKLGDLQTDRISSTVSSGALRFGQ